jgi:O-antigen/teichoic acid export membrane protein
VTTNELTAEELRPARARVAAPVRPVPVSAAPAVEPAEDRSAKIGRVVWGMADQFMSSGTNFLTGLLTARALGPVGFGQFSLVWATYSVLLTMSRGLATDPLTVRFSDGAADGRALRDAIARSTGLSVVVGLLAGAVAVAGGWAVGGGIGRAYLALGLLAPALLLQDAWRYAALCAGRPRQALMNDTVWGIALVPALILAIPRAGAAGFVMAWGGAAAVAAGFGFVQWRIRPDVARAREWLDAHRDLGTRYLVENTCVSLTGQVVAFGLGGFAGVAAVGAMRAAGQLMGPFTVLLLGISFVVVPEGTRLLRSSPHRFRVFCVGVGAVLCGGAVAVGVALMFLPDRFGRELLGATWAPASVLLLPTALVLAGAGLSTGAGCGLRALGAAKRALWAQLWASGVTVVGGLVGAWADGARGCCWGMAGACAVGAGLMWFQFGRAWQEHQALPVVPVRSVRAGPRRVLPAVFQL